MHAECEGSQLLVRQVVYHQNNWKKNTHTLTHVSLGTICSSADDILPSVTPWPNSRQFICAAHTLTLFISLALPYKPHISLKAKIHNGCNGCDDETLLMVYLQLLDILTILYWEMWNDVLCYTCPVDNANAIWGERRARGKAMFDMKMSQNLRDKW